MKLIKKNKVLMLVPTNSNNFLVLKSEKNNYRQNMFKSAAMPSSVTLQYCEELYEEITPDIIVEEQLPSIIEL